MERDFPRYLLPSRREKPAACQRHSHRCIRRAGRCHCRSPRRHSRSNPTARGTSRQINGACEVSSLYLSSAAVVLILFCFSILQASRVEGSGGGLQTFRFLTAPDTTFCFGFLCFSAELLGARCLFRIYAFCF